jgi:hypothetical protein
METGQPSPCSRTGKKVHSGNERKVFLKEKCHHQLPLGLGDPIKTESSRLTLPIPYD